MEEAEKINLLKLLEHALDLVRPFVKLNAEQSAAWDIVRSIASGLE